MHYRLPTKSEGGCTASVVLQLGSKLYVANAGDSQTFVVAHIAKSSEVKVLHESREDKPDLPEERARIERMGGSVWIPGEDEDDTPRAVVTDPETGRWFGLAMSRSIGDWDVTGVIAEPIVDVLNIQDLVADIVVREASVCSANSEVDSTGSGTCVEITADDVNLFAVSATDGMLDYLNLDVIAATFAKAFYDDEGIHPLTACKDLILQAANRWDNHWEGTYRDDIAVAACKITTDTTR